MSDHSSTTPVLHAGGGATTTGIPAASWCDWWPWLYPLHHGSRCTDTPLPGWSLSSSTG